MSLKSFGVLAVLLWALTGCQQQAQTPEETPKAEQAVGPAMQFWVQSHQVMVVGSLASQHALSDDELACLTGAGGEADYLALVHPYMTALLSEAEIAEADAFYGSSAGRKFTQALLGSLAKSDIAPPAMSEYEKTQVMDALAKPFIKKLEQAQDAMSDEELDAFLAGVAASEKARCQVGTS